MSVLTVAGLMRKLSFNELANTALGMDGAGEIAPASYARLIDATNNALLDLHGRFPLNQKELVIRSKTWKSKYPLRINNAMSNDLRPDDVKFIHDTCDKPFTGDLIAVMYVYNEIGEQLPVNDAEQWASVFTPEFDVLQLTHPSDDQAFFVTYQAHHNMLAYNGSDPELVRASLAQRLNVPMALQNALRYKVAAGIFSSMSGQEYSTKSQALEGMFEAACIEVEGKNLLGNKDSATNVKLERRGFI